MAERRMFTQKITEADNFTALPPTTQCLYFHLCMNADDDGFSNKIRQAMFNAHADQNDFEMLVQKRFILPFDSGVIVIKHWRMHNLIRADRYHETDYLEEKAALVLKENGVYTDCAHDDNQMTTKWQPSDNQMETEVRLGKVSIGKDSIDNKPAPKKKKDPKEPYGAFGNVKLTIDEYNRLVKDYGQGETDKAIDYLDAYIEDKGYKSKSHNMAMRRWVFDAVKEQEQKRAKLNGARPSNRFNQFEHNSYTQEQMKDLENLLLDN